MNENETRRITDDICVKLFGLMKAINAFCLNHIVTKIFRSGDKLRILSAHDNFHSVIASYASLMFLTPSNLAFSH